MYKKARNGHRRSNSHTHAGIHGAAAKDPDTAWGPTTQAAVTRFLNYATTCKTKLHAVMGKTQTEVPNQFMNEYMGVTCRS